MTPWNAELELCRILADEAAEIALSIYGRDFGVEHKSNDDPVTEADKRVNAMIVSRVQAAFPNDLVIGEESEFGESVPVGRVWFIDPVDGTSDFVKKNGEWSIMIGLVVDGVARVGVVHEPALGAVYWAAEGQGCWRRRGDRIERVFVSSASDDASCTVVLSRSHPDPKTEKVIADLGTERRFLHGSVGCKVGRIIDQQADVYFNFSGACHMWDVAGPDVILREAGGALTDVWGAPIAYTGASTRVKAPFVATTSARAGRVLPVCAAVVAG